MARWYLCNTATDLVTTLTYRGTWDQTNNSGRMLSTNKAGDGGTNTSTTYAPSAGYAANWDYTRLRFIGRALGSGGTISGNVDMVVRVKEALSSHDSVYAFHLYVTVGDTDVVRGTLISNYVETLTDEWTTANAGQAIAAPITVNPVVVTAGDRIVLELGNRFITSGINVAGIANTISYGGTAADITDGGASNLTPWIDIPDPSAAVGAGRGQAVMFGL